MSRTRKPRSRGNGKVKARDVPQGGIRRPRKAPAGKYDVIVLAASAGGLVPVMTILGQLPADFPVPIVLMQHLHPQSDALALYQRIPFQIELAGPASALERGKVFICPPRLFVELLPDRTFAISPCERGASDKPVDRLLESVALSFGERGIGVILSGMGSDGARGACELRLAHGCVLVQEKAEFSPLSETARRGSPPCSKPRPRRS